MESAPSGNLISYISNYHTRCLKVIPGSISPIALVHARHRPTEIVNAFLCMLDATIYDNQHLFSTNPMAGQASFHIAG